MTEKIKVRICTGTACFVMGGSELLMLEDYLSDELKEKVEISGITCMDYCKDSKKGKSPFVEVNGIVLSDANVPKVINYIEQLAGSIEK